jgi:hypothetical protein
MACDDTREIETSIRRRAQNDMEEEHRRLCPYEQKPVASKKQAAPKTAQTSRTERRGLQGMRDSIHRSSAV